ncbi:MAG: hypothetical protein VX951_09655 [Planctomycetota bacterium]|nr:hypothetical protein [Planctomycetota bacterium]
MTATAHPDRQAETLAQRAALLEQAKSADANSNGQSPSNPGDARVDLQLLRYRALRALRERGTDAAMAAIAGLDSADFTAGTVQDGTARGLMVRLEEVLSLCTPRPPTDDWVRQAGDDPHTVITTGKELRRKRDILVASDGARVRISRRSGCLLVDRRRGIHEEHCIQFEDQADVGCLDDFRPDDKQRPRLYSPAFLLPTYLHQGPIEDRLVLEGQLGRGQKGHPCKITLVGRKDEAGIRMTVWVLNRHLDHRLRIRFVGLSDGSYVSHRGTPGFEHVHAGGRTFLAATLLRACGRLRVGNDYLPTPAAQLLKPIEHSFGLGVVI